MVDALAYLEQTHALPPKAAEALRNTLHYRSYKKNDVVQEMGSVCNTLYLVVTGSARIYYYKDGTDITEHFAFPGALIVRAESLFTGSPTAKGIQTLEKSQLAAIDAKALFALYDAFPEIERLFRLLFERELVHAVKRLESLQFQSARQRYLELMANTDYIAKIPLKYIASYLGITQVSLSRIRATL